MLTRSSRLSFNYWSPRNADWRRYTRHTSPRAPCKSQTEDFRTYIEPPCVRHLVSLRGGRARGGTCILQYIGDNRPYLEWDRCAIFMYTFPHIWTTLVWGHYLCNSFTGPQTCTDVFLSASALCACAHACFN